MAGHLVKARGGKQKEGHIELSYSAGYVASAVVMDNERVQM